MGKHASPLDWNPYKTLASMDSVLLQSMTMSFWMNHGICCINVCWVQYRKDEPSPFSIKIAHPDSCMWMHTPKQLVRKPISYNVTLYVRKNMPRFYGIFTSKYIQFMARTMNYLFFCRINTTHEQKSNDCDNERRRVCLQAKNMLNINDIKALYCTCVKVCTL